ncbi:hypothetical protein FQA39_LY08187 [Lamprigera yunnana]|nr:hypothetical protein FQA39_LY08187 [Lamprigera yunnana]
MSGEDWSDYSCDDPEYEISDHSEMSDSDGSYSDTDDDEDIPTVSFNNWNVLSDPFADKIPRPLKDFSAHYDFHPAIDFQECKNLVNCFEHFMSPNIVAKLFVISKRLTTILNSNGHDVTDLALDLLMRIMAACCLTCGMFVLHL